MQTKHEYKGYTISKRSGSTHRTRPERTGYLINAKAERFTFSTLTEAKAWVDAKVAA